MAGLSLQIGVEFSIDYEGYWVLSLCTVFSNYFNDTITTKLRILGYYCPNGGLYHKIHVIGGISCHGEP